MIFFEFIADYWWLILVLIAAVTLGVYFAYTFLKKPRSEQLEALKQWLLYAVAEAERILGSGTGELKLRYVYDMFVAKFPFLVPFISFETFSKLVDEVLDEFRDLLDTNESVRNYVENPADMDE